MSKDDPARLAVLIDADNTSSKIAEDLFLEIAKIGEASVRRIYGDFSDDQLKGWARVLSRHAIIPHQQFAYTVGKNSSDIALVIDAMDLLHSRRFDGFVLVSSDSDFTRLASRIREEGVDVYGVGRRTTPEAFRQACKRFIFTENLSGAEPASAAGGGGGPTTENPAAAAPIIRQAMEAVADEDGWAPLGALGSRIGNMAPDFDTRSYGSGKLSDLIRRTGKFEMKRSNGNQMMVREK
ncbi:NYN domain-containing protein [Rhodovulum sp. DZ06]|uniref:NYN domain-containing protein n=1 Tax=Rhodovulum sp. DZ06 TaxID=3425126 RepID=UPI003D3442EF